MPASPKKAGLIVTADDYGLHESINRGILSAVRNGVVTSVHVMANLVTKNAMDDLKDAISDGGHVCGIGLHLNTTWGPALIQQEASFKHTWENESKDDGTAIYTYRDLNTYEHHKTDFEEMKREMVQQFITLADWVGGGENVDAISSHYNIHFWDAEFLKIIHYIAKDHVIPVRSPLRIDNDYRHPKASTYEGGIEPLLNSAANVWFSGLSGGTLRLLSAAASPKKLGKHSKILTEEFGLPSPRNMCGYWFGQPNWKVMEWLMQELNRLHQILPGYSSELFMHLSDSPENGDERWDYSMQKRFREFSVLNKVEFIQNFNRYKEELDIRHGSYRTVLQES